MKISTVTLTPAVAKLWLAQNEMNRNLRANWVEYLANEMRAGRWQENGDTFKFDTEGILIDGQHRCQAVIDADYSYQATVVKEIAPDARLTIDDPRLRRFSDDLTMNGQQNSVLQESLLRKIRIWESDGGFSGHTPRVSRSELALRYPEHAKEIRRAIEEAGRFWRAPLSKSITAFMIWLLSQYGPEDTVEKFFSILSIGSQDDRDYAVVRVRDKLDAIRNAPRTRGQMKEPLTAVSVYHLIQAWNSWVTGSVTQYSLPRGGLANPYPVPIKVGE